MLKRGTGILLPIFSLPSKYGIGDFGEFSYKFVDLISKYGFKYWQILPLNPVDISTHNSPYMSFSLFAGNPLFISIEFLIKEKLIDEKDIGNLMEFKEDEVEYEKVYELKEKILNISYENFIKKQDEEFLNFCNENAFWLESFSIFNVLKKYF
jgi:4-alpha-glucanotransferase